jgi:DNA-binding response OmpR family regulator
MCAWFEARLVDHHVVTAPDSDAGLKSARKSPFDLYLLNAQLSRSGAADLCRAIRQFDPHTPIISYSDGESMLESGANAHFVKPLDAAELKTAIDAAIHRGWIDSMAARIAEHGAVLEELKSRSRAVGTRMQESWEESERVRNRLLRLKAYRVYMDAGGARANFYRIWPGMADSFGVREE